MKKLALRLVSFAAPLTLAATAFAQEGGDAEGQATAIAGRALAAGLGIGIAAPSSKAAVSTSLSSWQGSSS